jgi:glycosyltransferase involved in cell wall biosynthesis
VKRSIPSLVFVVPCYNEEEVLGWSASCLLSELQDMAAAGLCDPSKSGILFIDDGSKDSTWPVIESLAATSECIGGLRLSRNKGHQSALIAGLEAVAQTADVSISVDADLQDDINVCSQMLESYLSGSDIVYGVRLERQTDTASKRFFAKSFYYFMQLLGAEIVPGHADFRMLSKRVLLELLRYQERSLFLRGIIPQLGYKTAIAYYTRKARSAGVTKYPFRKSLSLAVDGIFSLSHKPLRLITYMGLALAGLSVVGIFWTVLTYFTGGSIQGWTSMTVLIVMLGGAQLLCLGIIGEYLGRLYKEVKRRPLYHVEEDVGRVKWD